MTRRRRRLHSAVGLGLAAAVGASASPAMAQPAAGSSRSHAVRRHTAQAVNVSVGAPLALRPIPNSFLGLSLEYYELPQVLGQSTKSLNPIFPALVRLLNPGGLESIRLGGESADWSWVPTRGVRRPAPVTFTITPALESVLAATARELNARYLLDLNLAANNPAITGTEGRSLVSSIGSRYIRALEIGNEPDLYPFLSWSRPPLAPLYARGRGYTLGDYEQEFDTIARQLPPLATAGPATGSTLWAEGLAGARPRPTRLGLITVHRYALERCGLTPRSPLFPTVAKLLEPSTAFNLAALVEPVTRMVHASHLPIRVDELNSAPCFGVPGVSNTFASALWALQSAFALAQTGVDGINIHTAPAAAHRLFNFWQTKGVWHGNVFPEFYGFEMFALAAPAGSQMLHTASANLGVTAWATRSRGQERVVLVNSGGAQSVSLSAPGTHGPAATVALTDRSPSATSGVSLGGTSIPAWTTSGAFSGPAQVGHLRPDRSGVRYGIRLAAHSALLITLPQAGTSGGSTPTTTATTSSAATTTTTGSSSTTTGTSSTATSTSPASPSGGGAP